MELSALIHDMESQRFGLTEMDVEKMCAAIAVRETLNTRLMAGARRLVAWG